VQAAAAADRWLPGRAPAALAWRFAQSVAGRALFDTPLFRLPELYGLQPDHRVVDASCGAGALLRILDSRVRFKVRPLGLDPSAVALRAAASAPGEAGPLDFARATVVALPLADETADLILCGHLVKYLTDAELLAFMRDAYRALRPAGALLIWEFAPVRDPRLDSWNRRVVTRRAPEATLRSYRRLEDLGIRAGFDWLRNAYLRPFLAPPIPRVSILMGKAAPFRPASQVAHEAPR
jgi:SAM-dependent methyltransferase